MTNSRRDFFRLAAVPVAWHAFQSKLEAFSAARTVACCAAVPLVKE